MKADRFSNNELKALLFYMTNELCKHLTESNSEDVSSLLIVNCLHKTTETGKPSETVAKSFIQLMSRARLKQVFPKMSKSELECFYSMLKMFRTVELKQLVEYCYNSENKEWIDSL